MARTRSADAHRKVLDATAKLVAERGVDATSMDAVAEASGVSKATIYKHWADKEALLLEMMAYLHGLTARPSFDTGDTRADMIAVLAYHPKEGAAMREKIMPQFVAYSARNAGFGLTWRRMVMEPPIQELKRLMKAGMRKGELRRDLDLELGQALLLGPMIYWHVFAKAASTDRKTLAEGVIEGFWRAFGATAPPKKTARKRAMTR